MPETIAATTDPATNFDTDLRAFVAILATRDDTHVTVHTTARVIPGGPFSGGLAAGSDGTATLQQYDVLNLETGDFNADFTGSTIDADQPVVVFPGSEASDAPMFTKLADRFCCADHLEHQETPVLSVGRKYALAKMPSRAKSAAMLLSQARPRNVKSASTALRSSCSSFRRTKCRRAGESSDNDARMTRLISAQCQEMR